MDQSPVSIIITDTNGKVEYVNSKFCEVTGYGLEELVGKKPSMFKSGYTQKSEYANLWETVLTGHTWKGVFKNRKKNNEYFWESATIIGIKNKGGQIANLIGIKEDITDKRQQEEELIGKNTELKIINEELDRFVYSTSHDLRSPLTSMLGLVGIIKELQPENLELMEYLGMMEESIHRLDTIIKEILDYSRNNRTEVKNEPLDILGMYNGTLAGLGFLKGFNKVQTYVSIDQSGTFISDKVRVSTIIRNLVTNAIKYRREAAGPYLKFTFKADDKEGIITVEDNGEGIPANKVEKVFDMFFRNSSTSTGSGLGLYIVKKDVEKLKGTIALHSEVGKGSLFTVKVPNNI